MKEGFHEVVASDEAERFEGYGLALAAMQKRRAQTNGRAQRALHVKPHVGVVGTFNVAASAPGNVGIFAEAGKTYPLYARFSNGTSSRQPDKTPDARGFAVKLVGVPGKKLIPGLEDALTQDFLLIGDPSLPFRDPAEFMAFVGAAADGPLKILPRLIGSLGFFRALAILKRAVGGAVVSSYATHEFHTGAPIAFGDSAAKLALTPKNEAVKAAKGDDFLGDDLAERLAKGPLVWTLRAQLFVDDQTTPIEDSSVTWTGPWVELGTLTLPQQDVASARGKEISALVETLSFDPWHAAEAHRPLGSIMRARNVAYRHSTMGRKAAGEPTEVLSLR